jgi:hypothetical protein
MTEVSRRGFMVQATMLGAAAAAGATASSMLTSDLRRPDVLPDSLVLHVRDLETAEVAILAGTEEIVYRDAALVGSLLDAFARMTGS